MNKEMAISYSGLTNYGKTSLPSVEAWGTNNNILRDPPKSITTRRIDKVTDNSFFTQELQDSSDRIAEMITAYPRGINPMVGVSYDNSNGGIGRGQALLYKGQQAKLPYRVMDHGAFRPPILAPVDLLPLSRMPRNTTSINPTIFNPDYSRKITCGAERRTTTDKKPRTNCPSTFFMKVERAAPKEVNACIVPNLQTYAIDGSLKYQRAFEQRELNTEIFIKQPLEGSVSSTRSGNKFWALPDKIDLKQKPTLQVECFTGKRGAYQSKFMRSDLQPRTKTVLEGEYSTNKNGLTKTARHTVLENAPSKSLAYSFTAPASNARHGIFDTRDLSTPSSYNVGRGSAVLLPEHIYKSSIPSMDRAIPQTRMRVK